MAGRGAAASRRPKLKKVVEQRMREVEVIRQMQAYRAALERQRRASQYVQQQLTTSDDEEYEGSSGEDDSSSSSVASAGGHVNSGKISSPPSSPLVSKAGRLAQNAFLQMLLSPPPKAIHQKRLAIAVSQSKSHPSHVPDQPTATLSDDAARVKEHPLPIPRSDTTLPSSRPSSPQKKILRVLDIMTRKSTTTTATQGESPLGIPIQKSPMQAVLASPKSPPLSTARQSPAPPVAPRLPMDLPLSPPPFATSSAVQEDTLPRMAHTLDALRQANHMVSSSSLYDDSITTARSANALTNDPVEYDASGALHTASAGASRARSMVVDHNDQHIASGTDSPWIQQNLPSLNNQLQWQQDQLQQSLDKKQAPTYEATVTDQEAPDEADDNSRKEEAMMDVRPPTHFRKAFRSVNEFRTACGVLVNNERLQAFIVNLIIVNSIMMGLGTFDFVDDNVNVNRAFEICDSVFLVVFTVELVFQFAYHGMRLFLDGWLFFDFLIVLMSWSLESLQVIRAFRVFRAFRLVTRLEVLRKLVVALFSVAPSMGAILALLMLIIYIYAVLCTILFQDLYSEGYLDVDYFGSLNATFFTLFQMMTLDWASTAREVMVKYPGSWVIFVSFLIITSFILYSLIIAVVCDAVKVTEHFDEDEARKDGQLLNTERIAALQKHIYELGLVQEAVLQSLNAALTVLREIEGDHYEEDGEDDNLRKGLSSDIISTSRKNKQSKNRNRRSRKKGHRK